MRPIYPTIHIKGIHFKNPFALLPALTELTHPAGRVTPELLMHYKALTLSEAALVITGPATVVPPNSRKYSMLRVDQPKYLDGLRALVKIILTHGAIPGIQITHPAGFEANELPVLARRQTLSADHLERMATVFRNACVRALEVGFRYIELDAHGGLGLHQLMLADQRALLQEIFRNGVAALGTNAIFALRMDTDIPQRDAYARLFLELGGDLVCLDPQSAETQFFSEHAHACMEHLSTKATPSEIATRLKRCRLLSISPPRSERTRVIASSM